MFELPDAKRVRRDDLDASSDDEATGHDEQHDAELLAKLHARMAGMLDLSGIDQAPAKTAADEDAPMTDGPGRETQNGGGGGGGDDDDAPEEFEFRLFTTTDPATKIALVDEDERALQGDGAMLRGRPLSYYIAGEPTAEARAELASAAVSGEEVLARARQRWWGVEMPWRVTRIPAAPGTASKASKAASKAAVADPGDEGEDATARRRRPGKKKRVALRVRERERKKKAEEQERAKMGKEEALKEKKKRLNRLKKLRKRAKAKDGKKGDGEGGAAADGDGDDSGSGSDGGDE